MASKAWRSDGDAIGRHAARGHEQTAELFGRDEKIENRALALALHQIAGEGNAFASMTGSRVGDSRTITLILPSRSQSSRHRGPAAAIAVDLAFLDREPYLGAARNSR